MALGIDDNEGCMGILSTKTILLLGLTTEELKTVLGRGEELGRCLLHKSVSRSGRPFVRACSPIGRVHGCRARRGGGSTFSGRDGE